MDIICTQVWEFDNIATGRAARKERMDLELAQVAVADEMGVSKQVLSLLENGKMPWEKYCGRFNDAVEALR